MGRPPSFLLSCAALDFPSRTRERFILGAGLGRDFWNATHRQLGGGGGGGDLIYKRSIREKKRFAQKEDESRPFVLVATGFGHFCPPIFSSLLLVPRITYIPSGQAGIRWISPLPESNYVFEYVPFFLFFPFFFIIISILAE